MGRARKEIRERCVVSLDAVGILYALRLLRQCVRTTSDTYSRSVSHRFFVCTYFIE